MQIPKILVLGATGRIGRLLQVCWPQEQQQVTWQTRRSGDGLAENWVVLDPLTQPRALARAATGQTAILCLAGVIPDRVPDQNLGGGQGGLADNIALAEAAIRAGAASGARVFLASSAAVYGDQVGLLDEGAALAPINDYGRAKADMETRGAALAAELGCAVTALRIGNIAGIDAIIGGWRPGFQLDQFADGRTPQRAYIGVQTLARVLGDLMRAPELPGLPGTLNIASPGLVEMGALLDAAGLAWAPQPAPETAIARLALSTQALARVIIPPKVATAESLVAEWDALRGMFKDVGKDLHL